MRCLANLLERRFCDGSRVVQHHLAKLAISFEQFNVAIAVHLQIKQHLVAETRTTNGKRYL